MREKRSSEGCTRKKNSNIPFESASVSFVLSAAEPRDLWVGFLIQARPQKRIVSSSQISVSYLWSFNLLLTIDHVFENFDLLTTKSLLLSSSILVEFGWFVLFHCYLHRIEIMAASGSSMIYSSLLFTVILSLIQMYKVKFASSELMTIVGGLICSLLFLLMLTVSSQLLCIQFQSTFAISLELILYS